MEVLSYEVRTTIELIYTGRPAKEYGQQRRHRLGTRHRLMVYLFDDDADDDVDVKLDNYVTSTMFPVSHLTPQYYRN